MRRISGNGFKSDEKLDMMIDRFEEMITETDKIRLAENLKYAMGLQILERLKNCSRINTVERMRLKDVIEDVNGNPNAGNTIDEERVEKDEDCRELRRAV